MTIKSAAQMRILSNASFGSKTVDELEEIERMLNLPKSIAVGKICLYRQHPLSQATLIELKRLKYVVQYYPDEGYLISW